MAKITLEFINRPKQVFEDATLSISDKGLFIVSKVNGDIVLFPFENVISVTEEKV